MTEPTVDDSTTAPDDPSQLILPYIDSGMRVRGRKVSNLKYALPGLGISAAGGGAALLGAITFPAGGVVAGVGAAGAAGGYLLSALSPDHSSGIDSLRAPARARRQRREMPLAYDELAETPVHGVRRVSSEGFVERDDGTLTAFIRMHGANTDLDSADERQRMISSLSGRADDRIGDYGFRYYSTTTEFDPAEFADRIHETADVEYVTKRWAPARAVLHDFGDWFANREAERWDAKQWCHYAVVSVAPWEVEVGRSDSPASLGSALVDQLTGEDSADSDGPTPTERERQRARMQRELRKRVATLSGRVFGPTPGVETEQAGGGEVAALLARYWTGTEGAFDRENPADPTDESRLAEALSAPEYDFGDNYVRVGKQYARTYWVADWPVRPVPSFLRELVTMRGVDVDVTVRFNHRDRGEVKARLKDKVGEVQADLTERNAEGDLSTLGDQDIKDDYLRAYLLLRAAETRAWGVTAYVTVRAGTRDALESAEGSLKDGLESEGSVSLNVEKARALEDTSDDVKAVAEEPPADLTLVSPERRARDLFESGSPVGPDVYQRVSNRDRSRLALGGAAGALFPAVSAVYDHDGGIAWGRNRQNGSEVIADPFDVGGPPHGLFMGDSGSGKTYSVVDRALRWWLAGPDRTLVLAGPFGDLSGLVDFFGGSQLVVGGSQTINPLAVSPGDGHGGTDAVKAKVEEFTAFISGVLREAGVDPGDYTTTIKNAAYRTYEEAGIHPHDPESQSRLNPVMDDYRTELADMAENPAEEAFSEADSEVGKVENEAGELLHKLSGFQKGRGYEHFAGRNEFTIEEGGLSYIDLQQLESLGDIGKSAALQTVLSRVYETVKSSGETLFLLDEAHYLLHNEETLEWLQRAYRHWRHHDGGLWLASQRAIDFVGTTDGTGDGHLETIRTQSTIKQINDLDGMSDAVAGRFDLNSNHHNFIDERAVRGDDDVGYSDALLTFRDMEGWMRVQIRSSPLEHQLLTHDPDEDPPTGEYLTDAGYDVEPAGERTGSDTPPVQGLGSGVEPANADD